MFVLTNTLASLLERVARTLGNRRAAAHMRCLDDDRLFDIGLTRDDVSRAGRAPLRRSLRTVRYSENPVLRPFRLGHGAACGTLQLQRDVAWRSLDL